MVVVCWQSDFSRDRQHWFSSRDCPVESVSAGKSPGDIQWWGQGSINGASTPDWGLLHSAAVRAGCLQKAARYGSFAAYKDMYMCVFLR